MEPYFILILIAGIIYPYIGYPLLLYLVSRLYFRPINSEGITPSVSLIISVHNEEDVIEEKIKNSLALDYPVEKLEIWVSSDASTDKTNLIVRGYEEQGVRLFDQKEHLGKTTALNAVLSMAKADIVVFTDANAFFGRDTLRKLVRSFNDKRVGGVTGHTRYISRYRGDVSGTYTRLEILIKGMESVIGSAVGADGAIFGIRRELYEPLMVSDISDLVIPLNIVRRGYRVVLDKDVVVAEEAAGDVSGESTRQIRITNRTLRSIFSNIGLLNPFRFGLFSFELLSHKLIRFTVPYFMVILFLSSIFLFDYGLIYRLLFFSQILFY